MKNHGNNKHNNLKTERSIPTDYNFFSKFEKNGEKFIKEYLKKNSEKYEKQPKTHVEIENIKRQEKEKQVKEINLFQ